MNVISLIASIAGALGALWIAWGDREATRNTKYVALVTAAASIFTLVDGFMNMQSQQAFETHMRQRADETRQRTEETLLQLTGGDGIPNAILSSLTPDSNQAALIVRNQTDYPLYDIELNVVDAELQSRLYAEGSTADVATQRAMLHVPQFRLGPDTRV